jgi:hypothetical protein
MSAANVDIIALAAKAKARGYDSPERIVARQTRIIERNKRYVSRPYRAGRAYNEVVDEDSEAIAAAIVLIESLDGRAYGQENKDKATTTAH